MDINILYLKTEFCCMACDGDIAKEEIAFVKKMAQDDDMYKDVNVEDVLNGFVNEINAKGMAFLNSFVAELGESNLTAEEQLQVLKIAINTIMADNKIEYSELKFFKRIRGKMSLADEEIIPILPNPEEIENIQLRATCPEKEDFLLPDIQAPEAMDWNVSFTNIRFDDIIAQGDEKVAQA